MTQEALSSLKALGNQLRLQLLESAEFRALTVVDRTILELSEILNVSAPPPPDHAAPLPVEAPPSEPVAIVSAIKPQARAATATPSSSQSRMAKAIAETIAAKAGPLSALSTGARFERGLSAAS